jgi:hypothetical protein
MSSKDAPTMQDWLSRQNPFVQETLRRGQTLAAINQALHQQWADEPWIKQIRVANIRGTTIIVFIQSAAIQVPLRYRKPDLLNLLKQQFRLTCTDMEVKVVPNH